MQANTDIGDQDFAAGEEDGWLENGDDSSWDRGDGREFSARNRGRGSNQGGGLFQAVMLARASQIWRLQQITLNVCDGKTISRNRPVQAPRGKSRVSAVGGVLLLGAWTSGSSGERNWEGGAAGTRTDCCEQDFWWSESSRKKRLPSASSQRPNCFRHRISVTLGRTTVIESNHNGTTTTCLSRLSSPCSVLLLA